MTMNPTALQRGVSAVLLGLSMAAPLQGQASTTLPASWPERLAFTVQAGQFNPAGNSEAFQLFDAALSRGTSALTPRVTGGAVRVRAWRRLSVVASFEAGDRRVQSVSKSLPAGATSRAAQQTHLDFTGVQTLGVQWQAWEWRQGTQRLDRLRVSAGAGAGQTRYALRQWGSFVDESRQVVFSDDLASNGRGSFGFLTAVADVPVTRWAAVQLDVRRQFGSATMNGDFATFDALDLSGTRFGVGLSFTPWR